eukprot:gene43-637_t
MILKCSGACHTLLNQLVESIWPWTGPTGSGLQYYNYKGFYGLVLLAICDARYSFTLADVGRYGSNNDSSVLLNSEMGQCFEEDALSIPRAEKLRKLFRSPIRASQENVARYVLAAICLRNYLRQTENTMYCPAGFVDSEESSGRLQSGEWRRIVAYDSGCLQGISRTRGSKYTNNATEMLLVTMLDARDGVHTSSDFGTPMFITALSKKLRHMLEDPAYSQTPDVMCKPRTAPQIQKGDSSSLRPQQMSNAILRSTKQRACRVDLTPCMLFNLTTIACKSCYTITCKPDSNDTIFLHLLAELMCKPRTTAQIQNGDSSSSRLQQTLNATKINETKSLQSAELMCKPRATVRVKCHSGT